MLAVPPPAAVFSLCLLNSEPDVYRLLKWIIMADVEEEEDVNETETEKGACVWEMIYHLPNGNSTEVAPSVEQRKELKQGREMWAEQNTTAFFFKNNSLL